MPWRKRLVAVVKGQHRRSDHDSKFAHSAPAYRYQDVGICAKREEGEVLCRSPVASSQWNRCKSFPPTAAGAAR
ncbi:hypothetical protein [Lysobacter gummosus]|uniref:hypothetical protein n=1 Tax=Lysobacter gummosus TaxID=262324 RepID=UPI003639F62F